MKAMLPNRIKKVLKGISGLIEEVNLEFSQGAMKVIAMDTANVCMVILDVPKESIQGYDFPEEDKPVRLGVSLNQFNKVLAPLEGYIHIEEKENWLLVEAGKVKSKIRLIEISDKEQKVPDLAFKTTLFPDKTFRKDVDFLGELAEAVGFNQTVMYADGDLGASEIKHEFKAEGENSHAKYSYEYLAKILAISPNLTTMRFAEDYPAEFTFEEEEGGIKVKAIIAPRVNSDI